MAIGSTKLRIEAVRTLAFGSIGAAYANVGTPLVNPANMVLIQNSTDQDVMISYQGGVDHYPIPKYSGIVLDVTANKLNDGGYWVQVGTQIQVKTRGVVAPTVGNVDVTVFYSR